MKNKNIKKNITIVLAIVSLISAIVLYNKISIKSELNETTVYVTAHEIQPRKEIKEDDVRLIKVNANSVPPNAFTKKEDIVGKWTLQGFGLATNSYFYKNGLVEKENLPDAALLNLEEGEVAVSLLVDLETSYANSIIPDTKLDLNFRTMIHEDNEPKVLLGTLAKNARVISVKDAKASDVFEQNGNYNEANNAVTDVSKTESNTLAKIYIFAIPKEFENTFNKAKFIGEVYPVVTDKTYDLNVKVEVPDNEVIQYIQNVSYTASIERGVKDGKVN